MLQFPLQYLLHENSVILEQKNLNIFSKFFFISIHFLIADTRKCISGFADINPEYIFSKKLFTEFLCPFSAGQSIDKCRMNMQYISIGEISYEAVLLHLDVCFCSASVTAAITSARYSDSRLYIVFRIICFHDLIQTCSAHFHKFL